MNVPWAHCSGARGTHAHLHREPSSTASELGEQQSWAERGVWERHVLSTPSILSSELLSLLLDSKGSLEPGYITQALLPFHSSNRLMSKQQKSCCAVQVCPPFHGMSCSVAFKSSPFVAATHNFWNLASAECCQLTSNIPLTAHQASEAREGFSLLSLSNFFSFFFSCPNPKTNPKPNLAAQIPS